jgi:hypothetical protein
LIEPEGSEAAYGRGHSALVMREYIKGLDFSRVVLPPRYQDWIRSVV